MSYKTFIGVDNGVTGSIGVIQESGNSFFDVPVKKEQSYTKMKQSISRIDSVRLYSILSEFAGTETIIGVERPMVNPTRWKASMSAIRALEATLIVIELLSIPYQYIDSKEWQKEFLPKGVKGSPQLKKASLDIGIRLFPDFAIEIKKHKDADGILIAKYLQKYVV